MASSSRIALVAQGGIFPGVGVPTADPARLWEQVVAGACAAREVPASRWGCDPRKLLADDLAIDTVRSISACLLDLPKLEPGELDPVAGLTLLAGRMAWNAARLEGVDRSRVGVILGHIALPTDATSRLARDVFSGRQTTVHPANRNAAGLPAAILRGAFGLGGICVTIDAACASSLYALKLAADELRAGRADAMLAGGVSRPDCLYTQMGFTQLRALSPGGKPRPFDAGADGLVVGEGAGVFVLKRLDDALRAGDTILATIAGAGLSNDIDGGLLAPNSEGQLRALRAAYLEAGWEPNTVDLIECHATGTPVGDAVEVRSLRTLWGPSGWRAGQCVLGSVKSNVGHLLTAAGSAALVKVLHALSTHTLPPTANLERLAPGLELDGTPFRVLSRAEPWECSGPRRAALSGFGFGGINAHVLLEEWTGHEIRPLAPGTPVERVGVRGVNPAQHNAPSPPTPLPGVPGRGEPITVAIVGVEMRLGSPTLGEGGIAAGRFRIPPRELEEMLPQQRWILTATADLLDRVPLPTERDRVGVYLGVSLDLNTTNFTYRWSLPDRAARDAAMPPLTANRTMGALASIAASRLAREFRLGGPSHTFSSEETSGLHALHAAVEAIRRGDLSAAIVGAVDLPTDARNLRCIEAEGTPTGDVIDAVVVLLLEPADNARRAGREILAEIDSVDWANASGWHSRAGAAEGLCKFVESLQPVERMLAVGAGDVAGIRAELRALRERNFEPRTVDPSAPLALAILGRDRAEFDALVTEAVRHLETRPEQEILGERIFWSPRPLGATGELAFVFPGSGNDYPGMGRDLAQRYGLPRIDIDTDERTPVHRRILAQVSMGKLVCDALAIEGIRPVASIGFSLGESSALFGLRAWTDRERMVERIEAATLFRTDLCNEFRAARKTWKMEPNEPVQWSTGLVPVPPDAVRAALVGLTRAYLMIINGPGECVIGGQREQVAELVRRLGATFVPVPHPLSVHCPIVATVADDYREFHRLPTTAPAGVRFYSCAWKKAYPLDEMRAAEALLAQSSGTLDLPGLIEQAYADGVRVFLEIGPGASASRAITRILGTRPHRARSLLVSGQDEAGSFLRGLAMVMTERMGREVPVVLSSPRKCSQPASAFVDAAEALSPLLVQTVASERARGEAHEAFLRQAGRLTESYARLLAFEQELLQGGEVTIEVPAPIPLPAPVVKSVALDRNECMIFAIGKIGDVLGPDFAPIDAFPTRVRLPDSPLMLVDRILSIEGEPRSMTHGRVVTEHDIHPGAWYLDGNRIPTCIAVESGQADLFLSGWLGIDFHTRGLAVYRLLDAIVTFHRGLPEPGQVIRYDIYIDRFFRQGETHLFRFRFEGTVNGEPLLTMRDGCAGFFSRAELDGGKGIVKTAFDLRPMPGVEPDDRSWLPPLTARESYSDAQVESLRRGDLEAAFGEVFRGKTAPAGLRLPGGRMRLVHRIESIDPRGGRFGLGQIRGEADIHPDDWFLTCHFSDDQVMPGTLMYECCMHTLRVYLLRLGWVGDGAIACEPVPGVASQLKCRGQVIASTKKVTYEIVIKERGYGPEPYVIVDALMYADGKPVVEIGNMSLRIVGLTEEAIRATWANRSPRVATRREPTNSRLYGPETIRAFAVGNPSEAFGELYRPFDSQRKIARLPGPPYQFLDRVRVLEGEPWKMVAGGLIEGDYDIPPDAWYFASDRQPVMPFAVLLEVALQPCGWLAAYVGSALTSSNDLKFRNLGGDAVLHRQVTPEMGTLTTRVKLTQVSSSGGMVIQGYSFAVRAGDQPIYDGTTTFGFFTQAALSQQIGLRDYTPPQPTTVAESFDYPDVAPFPDRVWRMIDRVEVYPEMVRGRAKVDPSAWFFAAHFYQDPVWPGSLGLEALLQLMKIDASRRWGLSERAVFHTMTKRHQWIYRGQVIPSDGEVLVQADITAREDSLRRRVTANGTLTVDGRIIYRMTDFTLEAILLDESGVGTT